MITECQPDAEDQYRYAATCIEPKPETTMLQLFLIGAALSHARPEPPPDDGLPTGPLRFHRERWRSRLGLSAFWR